MHYVYALTCTYGTKAPITCTDKFANINTYMKTYMLRLCVHICKHNIKYICAHSPHIYIYVCVCECVYVFDYKIKTRFVYII